jgi:GLPGLI family protein
MLLRAVCFFSLLFICYGNLLAQKSMSEGSLQYKVIMNRSTEQGPVYSVFLKGGFCRTDLVSSAGTETTLHDPRTGEAAVLKDYSGQKLMIHFNKDNWNERSKKYDSVVFLKTAETKSILGYSCKKATATLKDNTLLTVYYTSELTPGNKEYDPMFKNLPGLPMEYELLKGNKSFAYTIFSINFDPVIASKFEWPTAGYRVLSYEETRKNLN